MTRPGALRDGGDPHSLLSSLRFAIVRPRRSERWRGLGEGTLRVGAKTYRIHRLAAVEEAGLGRLARLPRSIRVLLENLLRHEDGVTVTREDIAALASWRRRRQATTREIAFRPARVVLQDLTGVPAVVDLAVMRDAMAELGGDPKRINPLRPADLVIDHSVQVDFFGTRRRARRRTRSSSSSATRERFEFLRWGQSAFSRLRVVPPATGIVHQVNLEYLAPVVFAGAGGRRAGSRSPTPSSAPTRTPP